jgi:tetratricopeptide (TPR) repeat protein
MSLAVRLVLCFSIGFVPATVQAAKVSVKFIDHLEKPLNGVEVKLVHESARETFRKAGKNTELEFEPTDKGRFHLMAQRKGYLTIKSDSFQVEDKDVQLEIKLVDLNQFRKIEAAGKAAFEQGRYQEALQHFQTLNSLVPTEPVTWSNLALSYAMSRDHEKALQAVRKAATYDSAQFGSEFEKMILVTLNSEEGNYQLEQKNYTKAVEALTKSAELDATKAETFYSLALSYGQLKKYPEALTNIAQALKLKPDDSGFLEIQRILKHNASIAEKPK